MLSLILAELKPELKQTSAGIISVGFRTMARVLSCPESNTSISFGEMLFKLEESVRIF